MLDDREHLATTIGLMPTFGQRPHRLAATEFVQHQAVNLHQGQIIAQHGDLMVAPDLVEKSFGLCHGQTDRAPYLSAKWL